VNTITPDVTVVWAPDPPTWCSAAGSRQGLVDATYRRLTAVFGDPNVPGDGKKVHREWRVHTPDGDASVYDYQHQDDPADTPDAAITWHVGGQNPRIVGWVAMAVSDLTHDRRRRWAAGHVTATAAKAAVTTAAAEVSIHDRKTKITHAYSGGHGADWLLGRALELIDDAVLLRWWPSTRYGGHHLMVCDENDRVLHFQADPPARTLTADADEETRERIEQFNDHATRVTAPRTPKERLVAAYERFEEANEDPDNIDDPDAAIALAAAVGEYLRTDERNEAH
jgi:hypothetical protein